jgi:hypothetical protein
MPDCPLLGESNGRFYGSWEDGERCMEFVTNILEGIRAIPVDSWSAFPMFVIAMKYKLTTALYHKLL